MAEVDAKSGTMNIGGVALEVDVRGEGKPLLLLASEEQLELGTPLVDQLAARYRVVIPSAPGFGRSERPDWMTRAEDAAYVYLDLVESLNLRDVTVLGFSLGGWQAAEMAVMDDSFIATLVLVDPYGVKIGGPLDVDIQDLWIQTPETVAALTWRDPSLAQRDYSAMSEDELTVIARNRETFARFCWEPYMHNPKLKHRLHRISAPTLLLWGENDGIVTPDYGKAYAGLIPGARFETIPQAGHFPHLENPQAFMQAFERFVG